MSKLISCAISLILCFQGSPAAKGDVDKRDTVNGVVVDSDDKPICGALIWTHGLSYRERVTTLTGEDGLFELRGIHPDSIFVFTEIDGFRTGGTALTSRQELRITLRPCDAPGNALPLTERKAKERHELLKSLLLPIYPVLLESDKFAAREAIQRLAPYDRDFAIAQAEKLDEYNRILALIAAGATEDALRLAETHTDRLIGVLLALKVADVEVDAARKKKILRECLANARNLDENDQQVRALADVAARLYGIGDKDLARRVVEQARPKAQSLDASQSGGHAVEALSRILAVFDPQAGYELSKDLPHADSQLGNMAQRIADIHPEEAERLLGMMKEDSLFGGGSYASRVCFRMGRVDPTRAYRIAEGVFPEKPPSEVFLARSAVAYAALATSLAKLEPDMARELLRRAMDRLRNFDGGLYAFPAAMALATCARTVDPDSTEEFFWLAATTHPGPCDPRKGREHGDQTLASSVLLLAVHEQFPNLQRELMTPIFERFESRSSAGGDLGDRRVIAAMALTDPQRTIRWYHRRFGKLDRKAREHDQQIWQLIADVFASDADALPGVVHEKAFHYWMFNVQN